MNSNSKEIIRGTAGYFTGNIINAGLNFIFVILATRLLGVGGYGLIALGVTVFGLSNNFGLFGFSLYSQKVLSGKFDQKKAEVFGSMFLINFAIAILLSLLLFWVSEFISIEIFNKPDFAVILKIIAFAVLFSLPNHLFRVALKAQKKVKKNLLSICLESILKIIFLTPALVFENNLLIVAMAIFFSSLGSTLATFGFILKEKILPVFSNLKINIKKTVFLSSQFLFVGMGYFLSSQTDRLMLGGMVSSEELGYYAIAASMAMIMQQIHASMVSIFMPLISDAYKKGKRTEMKKTYLFANVFSAIVTGASLIFVLIVGKSILTVFNVGNIDIVYFVLLILGLRAFLGSIAGPTGAFLNMAGKHRVEFFNTALLISLNITLNYFMIREYGALGAGIATLLSALVASFVRISEIYKFYHYFIIKKVHLVFLGTIGTIGTISLFFESYNKSLFFNLVFLILAESLFLAVIYLFLSQNQKTFLKDKISHYLNLKAIL